MFAVFQNYAFFPDLKVSGSIAVSVSNFSYQHPPAPLHLLMVWKFEGLLFAFQRNKDEN
jgi:hypothetical protein